jgi:predicted GTPase
MKRQRVIIMGAAGRDFHNFNTVFRDDPRFDVVAFTAAQIPMIEDRLYPPELAGPLYPEGISVYPEDELRFLIRRFRADQVVFSYSDVPHEYVMHRASLCLAEGADFVLLGPEKTMLESRRPVISVCAARTGSGKSGVTKHLAAVIKENGLSPVVIRHPMPYADIIGGRSRRLESMEDLEACGCTIEEREEYEPLVRTGIVVFSGVDYGEILKRAEEEADIILWDGGNNDLPFIRPDLEVVVFDPHRAGHELTYHPGETNLLRADIAVINKVDTAQKEDIARVEENIRSKNLSAKIIHTASPVTVDNPDSIKGKKVLVVEDGPTLTHGGMAYGAGVIAAGKFGAAGLVDPRPYAKGSIAATFSEYPWLGNLLPAVGYSAEQMRELRETIEATPCDMVLIATPVDLSGVLGLKKKTVSVRYEVDDMEGKLSREIRAFLRGLRADD